MPKGIYHQDGVRYYCSYFELEIKMLVSLLSLTSQQSKRIDVFLTI